MALFSRNKKSKILVIDDSETVRTSLKAVLAPHYRVSLAEDGAAGLKHIAKEKPDMVLLDLVMPTLDGFKVLSLLRSQQATKDIPVFVITEQQKSQDVDRAMQLGATDYFKKSQMNQSMVLEKVKFFLDPDLPWDPSQQSGDSREVLTAEGDIKIKNKYDVDFYAKYERINGDLILDESTAANLDLPLLTSITGQLHVENNQRLTRLTLKNLRSVGGAVTIVGNPILESLVDLKKLKKVGGNFRVCDNGSLPATHPLKIRDMVMDAGGIGGDVEVTDNKGF
jgi:CheY-like chemotaxis protein